MRYDIKKIMDESKNNIFTELFDTFYYKCISDEDKVNFIVELKSDNILFICDSFSKYLESRRLAITSLKRLLENENLTQNTRDDTIKELSSKIEEDSETCKKFNTFIDFCMLHHDGK